MRWPRWPRFQPVAVIGKSGAETMPFELQAARLALGDKRPYLQTLLYSLIPLERATGTMGPLPTLAVDKFHRLYYNPEVGTKWNQEQLMAVLYHEVQHLLREHPGRGEDNHADPTIFNIAGDLEINDDIQDEEGGTFKLPKPYLHPKNFEMNGKKFEWPTGLMAEEYYAKILKEIPPELKQGGKGGKQEGGGGQPQPGQGAGKDQRVKQGQVQPGAGSCGSASHGQKEEWEEEGPGGAGKDGKPAPNGVSRAESELIQRKVAEDVRDYDPNAEGNKGRGDAPAWMKRWAKDKLNPKVPWQRVLAGVFRRAIADVSGMVDFTYRKPSRRMGANPDFVLPAFRRPMPRIVFVVDTSGSISDAMLAQDLAEVAQVLKTVGVYGGITVMSVDHAVGTCKKVMSVKQVDLIGGGGTDMGIGLAHAETLRPKPDIVCVLTDGITPWPGKAPKGFKVIIIIMGKNAMPTPPWGRVLYIDDPMKGVRD